MMTSEEAYLLLKKAVKTPTDYECYDYSSCYAFIPSWPSLGPDEEVPATNAYSVDKKTGSIEVFVPINIPRNEYLNGRKVGKFTGDVTAKDNVLKHVDHFLEVYGSEHYVG